MRPKYLFATITVAAVMLLGAVAAAGQVGQLRGTVQLVGADGKPAPVADAVVDVYRTDIAGDYHTKTNKNGEWVFAGLQYVGEYIVSVSAAGAQPFAKGGIKAGREIPVTVTLSPGDGRRLTLAEAKEIAKGGNAPASGGGGESATDKAKREELIRKNKEIEEANKKNGSINDILARTFKAGNDAINAKNYEQAVKQFDEGLAADPTQVVLYSRKATALRLRGVDHFNAWVKSTDQTTKAAELEGAKKDFQDSADAATKGVEAAKKETPGSDPSAQASQNSRKLEILNNRAESFRLLTKVDPGRVDEGATAYREFMAADTDPVRKAKAQMDLAQMLLDSGAADKAIVEFQKILDVEPDNVDALYGMGISEINIGYAANDKAKLQEAVNYLQRFVDKAPDTNRYKAEAKATIDEMKKAQNVTPEKTTTPPRRKRP